MELETDQIVWVDVQINVKMATGLILGESPTLQFDSDSTACRWFDGGARLLVPLIAGTKRNSSGGTNNNSSGG